MRLSLLFVIDETVNVIFNNSTFTYTIPIALNSISRVRDDSRDTYFFHKLCRHVIGKVIAVTRRSISTRVSGYWR